MKKTIVFATVLTLLLLAGAVLAQPENIVIQPGESVTIECAACPDCPEAWIPADWYPWGTQTWGYNYAAMLSYSHPGCIMSVPALWQFGPPPPDPNAWPALSAAFAAMDVACDNVGLVDSAIARLEGKATNLLNHGIAFYYVAYGPEGTAGVPEAETDPALMPSYAEELVGFAGDHGLRVVYGPSTELLALEWDWGYTYTLNSELIINLASLLPDDAVWFVRPFQFQLIYADDPDGFRAAVDELVGYIHQGNPALEIWAQLLLSPYEAGLDFLNSRQSLVGAVDATYMEVAGPSTPQYHPGTLEAMEAVWQATGD